MRRSLSITVLLLSLMLVTACGTKCVNINPEFPVPTLAILNAVDATGNEELINWVYKDLQSLWDKLR
jgi:hypothetical protein